MRLKPFDSPDQRQLLPSLAQIKEIKNAAKQGCGEGARRFFDPLKIGRKTGTNSLQNEESSARKTEASETSELAGQTLHCTTPRQRNRQTGQCEKKRDAEAKPSMRAARKKPFERPG